MKSISLWHGLAELLRSPSGVFSLVSLAAISVVTYHAPAIGAGAFVAFFAVVPTALGYFEHKETMKQMDNDPLLPPDKGKL